MNREAEIVAYLRDDPDLGILLPGGVYGYAELSVEGLTDPLTTPDVWTGGVFQACAIVRMRSPVPTGDLQSTQTQRTSMSQVGEVWVYALDEADIEAGQNRIYALMMGKRLAGAFSATWVGSGPGIMQAPELPAGVRVGREDYRVVSIRRPVTV